MLPTSQLLHGLGPKDIIYQPVVLVLTEAVTVIGDHASTVLPSMLQHEQPLKDLCIC